MSRVVTDSKMKMRDRLSFLIFIAIVIVTLCVNCFVVIANPNVIVNTFCDSEVVEPLHTDVVTYAKDMCKKNNLPDSFIENSITYDSVYILQKSCISGKLGASSDFNENAFETYLDEFRTHLAEDVYKMIDEKNVQIDPSVSDSAVDNFCLDIAKYVDTRVNLSYINSVVKGVKVVRVLSTVLSIIFGISGVSAVVYMSFKGGKTYRILRHISYSVLGGTIVGFINALILIVLKTTKDLVIYPLYIAQAFMNYVDLSIECIMISSLCLLTVFFLLISVVWKIKRDECD